MNPFGGDGSPFMMPFWWPRPSQALPPEEKEPPMRVRVAMDFLRLLTNKTSDGAVPHGVGAEVIEGQDLVPSEVAAQTAACELLRHYFKGDLKPDVWEETENKKDKGISGPAKIVVCVFCQGKNGTPDPNCNMCHGSGTLLIYPTTESRGG